MMDTSFTMKDLLKILTISTQKYKFIFYDEKHLKKNGFYIILRHDIDFSPYQAVELAKLEHEHGVKAVYFFHLHSEFYNSLNKSVKNAISTISELGHSIGVHADGEIFNTNSLKILDTMLRKERDIFFYYFSIRPLYFSLHNPTRRILTTVRNVDKLGDMINVYNREFTDNWLYISDSNGKLDMDKLMNILVSGEVKRIHLLFHPVWWQRNKMTPWEKVKIALEYQLNHKKELYRNLLRKHGRENIGYCSNNS